MDAVQIKQILESLAGGPTPARSIDTRGYVLDTVKFEDLTDDAKCELAKFFILDCCPRIGAFASNGDAAHFLSCFATELHTWPQGGEIANRRLVHVAFAISNSSEFLSPLGALSATFLVHQLEFLFRALGGVLNQDGTFISVDAKARAEIGMKRKLSGRINDIVDAYEIMRLNKEILAPRVFCELDGQLPPSRPIDQVLIGAGQRIGYFRHGVSHGERPDPSSEGRFYALLMAIAIYGSTLFPRGPAAC